MDGNDKNPIESERSGTPSALEASKVATGSTGDSPQPDGCNSFHFLTFTDFQQTTDPQTKKKVRSHVMHRVHQTMRSGGRARKEQVVVLDTSSLLIRPQRALLPAPRILGAGRSNPFANYPIPMTMRTRQLFDHREPRSYFRIEF